MVVINPWPETDWDALVLALVLAVSPVDDDELADHLETAENLAAAMSASQVSGRATRRRTGVVTSVGFLVLRVAS